jgi:hypothetical protein
MTLGRRVSRLLDSEGIHHALIGAAALAAAGVARSTLDLDMLTTDERALDHRIWDPVRASGVAVDVRRGDADDPLAGVVRVSASGERPVDLVLGRHAWQRRAVDRAITLATGDRVVQPRDLVLLKLYAGGTQDLWDIRQLLDINSDPTLIAHVEADLAELPAAARGLWAEVQRSHGA